MADHDHVCSVSGLTIGYQPVRVLLLAENEFADEGAYGTDGYWYPRGPAMRASYDRDGNEPREWVENITYRLAHDQFKADVVGGKRRPMAELLERLPGGLRTNTVYRRRDEHPDSYEVKLGKRRAAPWVPTPKRVRDVLKAAGIEGYAATVSYGQVKAYPPRPNFAQPPAGWFDAASTALTAAGYVLKLGADPTYGDSLVVRCGTAALSLDDVRAALTSGGWPEATDERVEEPEFTDVTRDFGDGKSFTLKADKCRESWVMFHTAHGFRAEVVDGGFRVAHCANGTPEPKAKGNDAYRRRLLACGIRAELVDGFVSVPAQERSFESLALQRRMRYLDAITSRYGRSEYRRRKMVVNWAVIREDVWQSLLTTRTEKGYRESDDGTFTSRKAACERAFATLLTKATEHFASPEMQRIYRDAERALDGGGRDYDIETAVWQDPPYRVGSKWSFCHLAVLKARGEVTDAECNEAVLAFAELAHVRAVLGDVQHQWAPPHTGRQCVQHDTIAKVHGDWARLAREDVKREKARRKEWDK